MSERSSSAPAPRLTRRALLSGAGFGLAGAACNYGSQFALLRNPPETETLQPEWEGSRVQSYRSLGDTGFAMSDIAFGCADLSDPDVARRAVERGVNYFDTSPDYSHSRSEQTLGQSLRDVDRERVFVVSKFCTANGHLSSHTPVPQVIAAVEASLRRLGTEYLDAVLIHAVNSVERLTAPPLHEAFDRLRDAGKVRFLGVSSHTPNLEEVMRRAVDSGRFGLIMAAYNFQSWPRLSEIFATARRRGVGVVAMKTLSGAYNTHLADFTPSERESFPQAAFKWVLANPDVSGLVISIGRFDQIDEYLRASGQALSDRDQAVLDRYEALTRNRYCRPGCGACLDLCPHGLPIDDILRYQLYAESYGREREASERYAALEPDASRCASCAAPCQTACPFELPIRTRLLAAHDRLVWS